MIDPSQYTIAELEAALKAKKAAAVEPDWEAWRPALEAFYQPWRNCEVATPMDDEDKLNVEGLIAALLLAPMPAQMGEDDASQALQDYMEEQNGIFLKASEWDAAIREALKLSRPAARWPGGGVCPACGVEFREITNVDAHLAGLKARILPETGQ
jgi:hypothetical protein